jgi:hypothetical protein
MYRYFILLIFSLLLKNSAYSQVLRYRLGANSSVFVTEPGKSEIRHPQLEGLTYEGSREFSPGFKIGYEAEVIMPLTSDFEAGMEFDFTNLYGHTPTAPFYNFFLSRHNPLPDSYPYPSEDLIYKTKILSVLGTTRLYFWPIGDEMNLFLRAFAGVAFTGTDFTFRDPFYRVEYDVGVLYARGTQNSEYPKKAAFTGGTGLGGTIKLTNKFDLYIDGTASFINSDIVNGVPNYDYVNSTDNGSLVPTSCWAMAVQITTGILYSAVPDKRLHKSNYTKSRKIRRSILWNRKLKSPFRR